MKNVIKTVVFYSLATASSVIGFGAGEVLWKELLKDKTENLVKRFKKE